MPFWPRSALVCRSCYPAEGNVRRTQAHTVGAASERGQGGEVTAFVIDESVAINWVVDEPGSERALRLIDGPTLSGPDLLMAECANIPWERVRRAELFRDEASRAIELLLRADVELVHRPAVASRAMALSLDFDHPAYDCMCLAPAIERGDAFVTADRGIARRVSERGGPGLQGRATQFGDVDRPLP